MERWDDEKWDGSGEEPPPQLPVEAELVGSVYMVPDAVWRIQTPGREDHPGICVYCDLTNRLAFLYKGTDLNAARADRTEVVVVEPSPLNGLSKTTAFALDPLCIRLHVLRNLHRSPRWLGRLESEPFQYMRGHFLNLLQLTGMAPTGT